MTESYCIWTRDLASNCEFRACLETGGDTGDNGKCSTSISWNTPIMIWKSVYHQVRMAMYSSPKLEKSWDIHEDCHWTWKKSPDFWTINSIVWMKHLNKRDSPNPLLLGQSVVLSMLPWGYSWGPAPTSWQLEPGYKGELHKILQYCLGTGSKI